MISFFMLFLCSCLAAVPSSRPAGASGAPRAGAVKAGRRDGLATCASVSRPRLDGPEHGARIMQVGALSIVLDALEGASLVEYRPGDAGELVGERDRQHLWCSRFFAASIHDLSP